jgi:hypothetical protein
MTGLKQESTTPCWSRHPERSASQMDRVTQCCSAESKDLGDAYFAYAARTPPQIWGMEGDYTAFIRSNTKVETRHQ